MNPFAQALVIAGLCTLFWAAGPFAVLIVDGWGW